MMLYGLLSNRWFQGGIVFFAVCVVGSLVYSWHLHRDTDREMTRHALFLQSIEKRTDKRTVGSVTLAEATDTLLPVETPTQQGTSIAENTEAPELTNESGSLAAMDVSLDPDGDIEETPAEDVPVSPFGYGPYPEVPADFPETIPPPWLWSEEMQQKFQDRLWSFELMVRVFIKLWNEGDHGFTGGEIHNGTVYPRYPNTVYVRYTEYFEEVTDGFIEGNITEISAGDGVSKQDIQMLQDGKIPPGIRVLDMDTDGINAYSFLNIK